MVYIQSVVHKCTIKEGTVCYFVFQGIIERDEIVFQKVTQRRIPIIMLTSGGYQRSTAAVIADSIDNLNRKSLISILV